jgi:hypothetical protein
VRLPRHARWALGPLVAAVSLSGCTGITAPDLFLVTRTATASGARLTVLVNEEGGVRCDAGKTLKLSGRQLIFAREIQEELEKPSSSALALPPGRSSVFSYQVQDANGSVRFSDDSAGQPQVLHKLALFVLEVAQSVCHVPS